MANLTEKHVSGYDIDATLLAVDLYNSSLRNDSFPYLDNSSLPPDDIERPNPYSVPVQVMISLTLIFIIIGTIIGNSLVCIAVGIVKKLQSPSNLLIVSLAVSDLLVALLVMPFALVQEVLQVWILGDAVCDMWTSLDVMLCTASILNLCMISVDRYFVITKPFQYAMKRTPRRMGLMIMVVWVASALISIPPLFGWKDSWKDGRASDNCEYSQSIGYQIYATVGAFYIPLGIMIFVYFKIWRVSSRIAKAECKAQMGNIDRHSDTILINRSAKSSKDSGDSTVQPNGLLKNGGGGNGVCDSDDTTGEMLPKRSPTKRRFTMRNFLSKHPRTISSKERKATKTLGIIMGGFTACWLPFFITAVVRPFCELGSGCSIPPWVTSVFLWLGYANSFLNPVIYARFNREFRTPFKEIICFRCRGINTRLRSESYAEQYGAHDPTLRDSLRPPTETIIRYNSQGQTVVQVGNGSTAQGETKI